MPGDGGNGGALAGLRPGGGGSGAPTSLIPGGGGGGAPTSLMPGGTPAKPPHGRNGGVVPGGEEGLPIPIEETHSNTWTSKKVVGSVPDIRRDRIL
eukprot:SAG11_NODE_3631_length_2323_cov_4.233363_2_plen_96_part_00